MKAIFLTSLLMSLGTLSFAQQTPKTPTSSTTVSTSSSTSSNYIRSVSNSDTDEDGNLSIAISESDNSYKLSAKFSSKNDKALKDLLLNEFGKENLEKDGDKWEWKLSSAEDDVYSIKFSSGKLKMELDKEEAANTLIEKFVRTGKEINQLLSGEEDQKAEALKRRAQHLQREAQRMQHEAERLGKSSNKEEVSALKMKAERLQQKVDSLQKELRKIKKKQE
ncbi:hypothetical protein JM83_0759 [Gillisia sp. Hel_I_86]|uniref:hypothetical protein n=1 Tax=Gillisia sp. Hel_I_86 TaxID=1249981 RepID=UPI00119C1C2D|nr:hypothetical protein [Gillisia sp. Hel_I_86]TVZ25828.1 hypothetical protein JM83_0759 [Gillisia sp. Hel_I_86]